MPVALEQFVKLIADSGVIAPGKLENFVPPRAHPKDAEELARQLVQSKQLTKFQVQEIYQGRAKSLILGNYTIVDKIGAGGMGQVFKAEHRRMHRTVAIKMLPTSVTKDAVAVARFQREVDAAAKLEHPNIVTAHDADDAGGVHFLVMQYVEGSDLSALVKKHGPLSVEKAVNYILQAARGLGYAHKKGVIHRDIKPANLLLDNDGAVKILDMGLARLSADDDMPTQAELTGTGAVMGTVDYMAPEQALSTKHADARADIYSLGCSLCYLITGKAAYDGDTLMAKLLAHRDKPIPSLGPKVPEQVQAVFEKMVAKNIDDRYQTMSAVVADLEKCSAGMNASLSIQPSAGSSSGSDVMTFLRNATLNTVRKPTRTKKAAAHIAGKGKRNRLFGTIGAGLLAAAILAAVVFKLRTKDGTLVVEVNQPDAVVEVLDADGTMEISQPGGKGSITIAVDPGNHRLKVEKDGFQFFAQDFEMDSGGTATIKATLVEDKPWFRPAFLEWQKKVALLPAEKQVDTVVKKLQQLNPGFDGKETHNVEGAVVTELQFLTGEVTDISPVRALVGLKKLDCSDGNDWGKKGKLSDLSPLSGMQLSHLYCGSTRVADLSPLKGMPLLSLSFLNSLVSDLRPLAGMNLTSLKCGGTSVADLSPLRGMQLTDFSCQVTPVSDLSALKGMPLTSLNCLQTGVSDFSPLQGMHLTTLEFTPANITKGIDSIRQMASLKSIGNSWESAKHFPPAEFWKKYDAGEFGKPDVTPVAPDHKPVTTLSDPAFQQWMKTVAALPVEKQADAVSKKLQEFNPGFDGKIEPGIKEGVVTRFSIHSPQVTDISPVRALAGVKSLNCSGTHVVDLTPLRGLELISFNCDGSPVSDLSPLAGMPLTSLHCENTSVSDISPLKGMPLDHLFCGKTPVSDVSPLADMHLTEIDFTPKNITRGMEVLRQMPSLKTICPEKEKLPSDVFWKKYDAGEFGKPNGAANDPAFQQWMKTVTTMPAEKQVDAVVKKLRELNPDFDGKERHKIEEGVVTELQFLTGEVTDISPVRALVGLKKLDCSDGKDWAKKGKLADLSPLGGMQLNSLFFGSTQVSDLSPLKGMPLLSLDFSNSMVRDLLPLAGMNLTFLGCGGTAVSDLSPLHGMQLTGLSCQLTRVSDLSALKGMPLATLNCLQTKVSDLSPLQGMHLTTLEFTPANITKGIDSIRQMASLKSIGNSWESAEHFPPAEFWKRYDAGEFGKPNTTLNDPAFQQWMKAVAAMSAEKQAKAVSEGLQQLNPGFDGHLTPTIEGGAITKISFNCDVVTNLSPLRALPRLRGLLCTGHYWRKGKLSDLSPLAGMRFDELEFKETQVADLSPLAGAPLVWLDIGDTRVADLSPLKGMPLKELMCYGTSISDLSPLTALPLEKLNIGVTHISDLSLLRGMKLTSLECRDTPVSDLTPLAGMTTLGTLDARGSKVTAEGVAALQKALPNCRINWDKPSQQP